jgi:serine/threonine protein phosphatase PrpC
VRTSWGSATDRGHARRLNEDALLAYPPVFLVADGMGGHAAGDVASKLVVEEFSQLAGRTSASADEVHACFARTASRLRETVANGRTAGTTVAGVAIAAHDGGSYWLVFNIGDSRVYRLSGGLLEQISVDHSVVQELLDNGTINRDQARAHPERHVITRAVGTGPDPEPDYWLIPAGTADRLLICSDGLTTDVSDYLIHTVLTATQDPQEAAQELVALALARGGDDNVTAVVVDVAVAPAGVDVEETRERQDGERPGRPADEQEIWDDEVDGVTVPQPSRAQVPEVNR